MLRNGRLGETYNVGGNNQRANLDVVNTICALLDELSPGARPYAEQIKFVQDRPGHDRRYAIDPSKVERELGWRATEAFETGIEKTVQWYLNHPEWWRSILDRGYEAKRVGLACREHCSRG